MRLILHAAIQRWCDGAKGNTRFVEVGKRWAIDLIEDFALSITDDVSTQMEAIAMPWIDRVKKLLTAALPLLEAGAELTPTQIDDQVVAFLKLWLSSGQGLDEFAATYQPQPV